MYTETSNHVHDVGKKVVCSGPVSGGGHGFDCHKLKLGGYWLIF